MKLNVIISIVKDPLGRKDANNQVYDVFKLEAVYTNNGDNPAPTMTGWEPYLTKIGLVNKYVAYADSLADVESKVQTLITLYWNFPPNDTTNT